MNNEKKEPITAEQVEHYKAYAQNHFRDLPLDVLMYITVLSEFSIQQTKALQDELDKIKELAKDNMLRGLNKVQNLQSELTRIKKENEQLQENIKDLLSEISVYKSKNLD